MAGLCHRYLAGLALDSGDPQNIIVSASQSAWQAHSIEGARSVVYRRTSSYLLRRMILVAKKKRTGS